MQVSFDVQLKPEDLFRFNIYQTYTTTQGPISIILAIIVFIMSVASFREGTIGYGVLYLVVGIVFIVYIPATLWNRAKITLKKNAVLSGKLHYQISEAGIEVSQDGDSGLLEWSQIYKMVSTKKHVLIYSNRVNAYIIPKEQIGTQYASLKEIAANKLEKHRIKMK